jgi:hypothetical protein
MLENMEDTFFLESQLCASLSQQIGSGVEERKKVPSGTKEAERDENSGLKYPTSVVPR